MQEKWKKIKDYEELYEISEKGEVRTLCDHFVRNRLYKKKGDIVAVCNGAYGYNVCSLRKNGVNKMFKLHRLLAQAFIPNPENKPQINHIDNNRKNNKLENLEWCTNTENEQHKIKQKRHPHGETHYEAKLKNSDVLFIREYSSESPINDLVKKYNLSRSHIDNIRMGRKWKHLL